MEYRAVENRCAVVLDSLRLPLISNEEILRVLSHAGFNLIEVDMVRLARECIGKSMYMRGASPREAPAVVDCSSLIKWLYGMRGIWLPRRSIQQYELGEACELGELIAGDVVFISGRIDYYHDDPANGIGHVGMAAGEGTIIHAAGKECGVVESSVNDFMNVTDGTKFRGIRRYIPKNAEILTFETPAYRSVEIADDIRWIILQSLPQAVR